MNMNWLHSLYRIPLLIILVVISLLALIVCNPIGHRTRIGQRSLAEHAMQPWAKVACLLFGLKPKLIGEVKSGPLLIVANHQSWQDVIVLMSLFSLRFVAKAEIRSWPVLGFLVMAADTVFLRRGDAKSSHAVSNDMAQAFKKNLRVLIFPEAGVTLTPAVGRFYGRLFAVAIDNNIPIQPIAIRYLEGGTLSQRSRFKPGEGFLVSFFRLLFGGMSDVEVHALSVIAEPTGSQRRELAETCEQQIRQTYDPNNQLDHEKAKRQRPV